MTTATKTRKARKTGKIQIPTPLFAAAGAGDLAYQELRKLPEKVAELRDKVAELRPVVTDAVTEAVSEQRLRGDLDRLRVVAKRNADAVRAGAQVAQEKAAAVYTDLVARGERVVNSSRSYDATVEATVEVTAARDDQDPLPAVADKSAKRARPAPAIKK